MYWGRFLRLAPIFLSKNSSKNAPKNNLYINDHCLFFVIH